MKTAEEILIEKLNPKDGKLLFSYRELVIPAMEEYASQFKPKWIKLENKLPPKNTLVLVKRCPNKVENEPIYFAMRQDKELSTNADASRYCYWFGNHKNNFLSQQERCRELNCFSNFSDVTIKEWAFIDYIL